MLRITKDTILSEQYFEGQNEIHDIINDGCFINHLGEEISIDSDVTLVDLLNILENISEEVELVFGASLSGCDLFPFIEEANSEPLKEKQYLVEQLIFGRICEIVVFANNTSELMEDYDFYGTGKEYLLDDNKIETEIDKEFALEFAPLNFYSHVPIKLDNTFEIVQHISTSTYIKEANGSIRQVYDRVTLLKTNKIFTLYEFLDTILFEISKYGTPEERNELRTNIFGDVVLTPDKIDNQTEKSIQSQIKELEKLEKDAAKKEDYEKSANYRDRINELKEKLNKKDAN